MHAAPARDFLASPHSRRLGCFKATRHKLWTWNYFRTVPSRPCTWCRERGRENTAHKLSAACQYTTTSIKRRRGRVIKPTEKKTSRTQWQLRRRPKQPVCACGPRKRTGRLERSLARGAYNYTRLPRLLSIGRTSVVTRFPIMPPTCRTRGEECGPGSRGRVRFTACCFWDSIVGANVPLILSMNAEGCIADF